MGDFPGTDGKMYCYAYSSLNALTKKSCEFANTINDTCAQNGTQQSQCGQCTYWNCGAPGNNGCNFDSCSGYCGLNDGNGTINSPNIALCASDTC